MSNTEENYLFLINKLMQGDSTAEERDELMQLAEGDVERLNFIKYLTSSINKTDLLEAEIVYEKTRPNDLIQKDPISTIQPKINRIKHVYKIIAIAASVIITLLSSIYIFEVNTPSSD